MAEIVRLDLAQILGLASEIGVQVTDGALDGAQVVYGEVGEVTLVLLSHRKDRAYCPGALRRMRDVRNSAVLLQVDFKLLQKWSNSSVVQSNEWCRTRLKGHRSARCSRL